MSSSFVGARLFRDGDGEEKGGAEMNFAPGLAEDFLMVRKIPHLYRSGASADGARKGRAGASKRQTQGRNTAKMPSEPPSKMPRCQDPRFGRERPRAPAFLPVEGRPGGATQRATVRSTEELEVITSVVANIALRVTVLPTVCSSVFGTRLRAEGSR